MAEEPQVVVPLLSGDLTPLSGRSIMEMSWQSLTFLHWSYPPEVVQALLPEGLTVETFEDKAWVGLIPFRMIIRPPGLPSVPWVTRFLETNVRTYVIGPDGKHGVWFFSLDASRLAAVVLARMTYKIPYFWSSMSIQKSESSVRYIEKRRWPKPMAKSLIEIEVGSPIAEPSQLDYFLTARGSLFSATKNGFMRANIFHQEWPLQNAVLTDLDDSAVTAAGLPAPTGEAHVRYSQNVEVTIGLPTKVARN